MRSIVIFKIKKGRNKYLKKLENEENFKMTKQNERIQKKCTGMQMARLSYLYLSSQLVYTSSFLYSHLAFFRFLFLRFYSKQQNLLFVKSQ